MHSEVRTLSTAFRARRGVASSFRLGGIALTAVSILALCSCGNSYRPVVSAINPVGPASQPQKYAVAVSSSGLASIVDFSGDTLTATAQLTGNPSYLNLGLSSDAYVLHCDTSDSTNCNGVIDAFSVSSTLMTKDVYQTSLTSGASPSVVVPSSSTIYVAQQGTSTIGVLSTGQPPTAQLEIPVTGTPTYIVTRSGTIWHYALSKGSSSGTATPILASNNTPNATAITVGTNPVYGVMNSDTRRAFVMNQGSNTVSVINSQANTLDTAHPSIAVGSNPVWADTADSINELAVLNRGDGTSNGSLSIISIPLCSAITQSSNTTCDSSNPVDGDGFGTVLRTVEVGKNPFMVSILQDQNKAYVANTDDKTISVIDLTTLTKIKDIPVEGRPTWIGATSGTPTGKVYVISPDNNYLQIIYTETDTLQTTKINLQGTGVGLRLTAQ